MSLSKEPATSPHLSHVRQMNTGATLSYHLQDSRYYAATQMTAGVGKGWLCTEGGQGLEPWTR
jgi:hypothetical protein